MIKNCEQCYVFPTELLNALVLRLQELGSPSVEAAENQFKVYLQGRRTTQTKMVLVRCHCQVKHK